MVAHAIGGSHLWRVRPEPQTTRNDAVRESLETCRGETMFDERAARCWRCSASPEEPTVAGGRDDGVVGIFLKLLDLPDTVVMDVLAIVMGETLASGSAAVGRSASRSAWTWPLGGRPTTAFFDLIRDREVLVADRRRRRGRNGRHGQCGWRRPRPEAHRRDHLAGTGGQRSSAGCRAGWPSRRSATPRAAGSAPSRRRRR
jgi:ParB family chromosome partitioning protein